MISQREKSTITQQLDLTERICHRIYCHKAIHWNGNFSDDHTRLQYTYGLCWLRRCGDELLFDIMPDKKVNIETFFHFSDTTFLNIFLLLIAWGTIVTHRDFGLYLIDWKEKGLPHTCWPLGRPYCTYMHWSALQQSSAISFLRVYQWAVLHVE
jgi:hypothetical protein